MILKWINKHGQWVIKDGFDEIRHKKEVNEKDKTITRIVSCYVNTDYENSPTLELIDVIQRNEGEVVKEYPDFTSIYILNNEGKTVERIN